MTFTGRSKLESATRAVARRPTARPARLTALTVWLLLIHCALAAMPSRAYGQNIQFTQGGVGTGLDNSLEISIISYPGRGSASLPVTLYYSSRVWRISNLNTANTGVLQNMTEAVYAEHSNAGWKSSLDLPIVEWPTEDMQYYYTGKQYCFACQSNLRHFRIARVFMHMPDGSTHELRQSDQPYEGPLRVTGSFYAVDGSRLRYDSTSQTTGTLYLPDGARYVLGGAASQFIDRNGNALNYDASLRRWTDTFGRQISMPFPSAPEPIDYNYAPPGVRSDKPYVFRWRRLSDTDVLTSPSAQRKPIANDYLPHPDQPPTGPSGDNYPQKVQTSWTTRPSLFISDEPEPEAGETVVVGHGQVGGALFDPVVLSEVILPTGLSYKFTYNVYGEIDKVVYPMGGYEQYQFSESQPIGDLKPPYTQASRVVTQQQQSPKGDGSDLATWQYAVNAAEANPPSGTQVISTTAPDGTYSEVRKHNFSAPLQSGVGAPHYWPFGFEDARQGLPYETRVYDKKPSLGGVMLRRSLTSYDWTDVAVPPRIGIQGEETVHAYRNVRPSRDVSLMLDTGGAALAKRVEYFYAAADPDTVNHSNSRTIETTTGFDRTRMTETHFAEGIDQTTAKTAAIGTIWDNYNFPYASSAETTYSADQSYRDRNILGLVTSVVLKDASEQVVSKTENLYDEEAYAVLAPYGDLGTDPNYVDPGTPLRANPTTVRRYSDIAAGSCLETHAQFDQYGNPVNFWDERGIQSQKAYSATYRHALLTQTTSAVPDPSGQHGSSSAFTASSTYDPVTGQVTSTTDANDRTTTFSYNIDPTHRDPLNRLRVVTQPDGGWTKTDYNDVLGNVYVHTETQFDATTSTHAYVFYDKAGRASRSFALEPGTTYVVSETRYDNMGRVSQTSTPFRTTVAGGSDPTLAPYWVTADQPAYWTTSTYDAMGRVKQLALPDSAVVTTLYEGVYTTVTDQAGRKRRQKTDALGHVVRVDEPDDSGNLDASGSPVQPSFYEYDTLGNVVRINQGLTQQGANPELASSYTQHRYFKYDALSRLTYEKQAEQAGTITTAQDPLTGNSAWSRKLTYDETRDGVNYKGFLTTAEDARHVVTSLYNDRMGRPYQATYSDGTPTVVSKYDQARTDAPPSGEQAVTFYNKGRLTEVTTTATTDMPQTSQLYDYDLMGRPRRQRQVVEANTYELRYAYNLGGGLVSERYPSGRVVSYSYDSAARTSGVSSGATAYVSAMTYKPFGGLASMTMGNGAAYTMSYDDERLQLTSISLTQGGSVVQKYDYKYGAVNMADGTVDTSKNVGQIARIEGTIGAQKQWQQRFQYDTLGRLASAGEYRGDNGQQTYLLNYDYDVYGNRQQKQSRNQNNPVSQSWVEPGSFSPTTNRLTSGVTYDDAGNVISDARFRNRAFLYDANNRQKQSSNLDGTGAVLSVLDGAGRRVAVKSGGVITNVMVYDMVGDLVAEYGGSVSTNGTRYVMGDQQGSARVVTGSTGTVVSRHDYLPFGEDVAAGVGMRTAAQGYSQPDSIRKKYAGMEADDATGMSHTLWREYDSLSARWTAPDPYGGSMESSSPQSFNRYAYVNNDPVNKVDPTGLMLSDIGVYQTDNPGVAMRLERARVQYTKDYVKRRSSEARREQRWQRFNSSFGRGKTPSFMGGSGGGAAASSTNGSADSGSGGTGGASPQYTEVASLNGVPDTQDSRYAKSNPDCWTANMILSQQRVKDALDKTWRDTEKSGEENTGWIFVDINSGDLFIYRGSQGRTINNQPQLPDEPKELAALVAELRKNDPKRQQVLLLSFHTHKYGSDYPSISDKESQLYRSGAGLIIHGLGKYTPHGTRGKWVESDGHSDQCLINNYF